VKEISVGLDPSGIAVGFGTVWVVLAASNTVVRVDPKTNEVLPPIDVGNGPGALVVSPDAVWVVNSLADSVSRIDPETSLETEAIQVGDGPAGIAFTEGAVWVANGSDGTLSRIDPGSKVAKPAVGIGSIPQGWRPQREPVGDRWRNRDRPPRGTLRLVSEEAPPSLDPVVTYANSFFQVMIITGDGLVGSNASAGSMEKPR
jgi:YVTN family beta-propeller protein